MTTRPTTSPDSARPERSPQETVERARREAEERARQEKLAKLYDGLESALRAGRWQEALRFCDAIATLDPGYRDVSRLRTRAESRLRAERATEEQRERVQADIKRLYEAIQAAAAAKDWPAVIERCAEIEHLEPGYRGVAQIKAQAEAQMRARTATRRRDHEHQQVIEQLSSDVERLLGEGKYRKALARLGELRRVDPGHPGIVTMERRARAGMARAPERGVFRSEWALALLLAFLGGTILWWVSHGGSVLLALPAGSSLFASPLSTPSPTADSRVGDAVIPGPPPATQAPPTALPTIPPATATTAPPHTRTPLPTRTVAPTETASATPVPDTPAPPPVVLLDPIHSVSRGDVVTFYWNGPLASGDVFDVRVCKEPGCAPRFGKTNTTATTWSWCPDAGPGVYRWQVAAIDDVTKQERGPVSDVAQFLWEGGKCADAKEKPAPTPPPPYP